MKVDKRQPDREIGSSCFRLRTFSKTFVRGRTLTKTFVRGRTFSKTFVLRFVLIVKTIFNNRC